MTQELYQWKAEGIYIMVMVITQFPQMITYIIIVRYLPYKAHSLIVLMTTMLTSLSQKSKI